MAFLTRKLFKCKLGTQPLPKSKITEIETKIQESLGIGFEELSYFVVEGSTSNAAYVQGELSEAVAVGRRLRAGQVSLNYPAWDTFAPFGGYKQSGNGREYADWGIHDFCEVKALVGAGA